ncbi:MAG TPA: YtxH domain-containing protein [Candidatus Alistipes merdigallinarum]|nr:YtxH domain-containing protein [Candidatus Alistipes merdigallinarum]
MKSQGLLSFLSGAAIGIAVALLFAPDSGANTRQKITEKLRQNGQKMKEALDESLHCCEEQ